MEYAFISSGSSGNAFFIKSGETEFLIDVGVSTRRIEQALKAYHTSPERLTGIFISHEHRDHVQGLDVLTKRYEIPVYMNRETYASLPEKIKTRLRGMWQEFPTGTRHRFGSLQVETFSVSHDAKDPMMFRFVEDPLGQALTLAFVTDTGYISDKMKETIYDAHVYVIEANHDESILRLGRYPWHLKQRILSDEGHLSNTAAAYALSELITNKTMRIHLAHLSEENNFPDLARLAVEQTIMEDRGRDVRSWLHVALAKQPTSLFTIEPVSTHHRT
ncbi:MAG: Zn-dependent hydrolase (beta-lactamase superfamily) [Candidatus Carbobacillus altaicus]|uniref:Zn-dependent hydrolase (Beta-lactamase superfamily) n=1 Tax=Candidatus Carbonibacillus altaicus TaxID=2163959 RepID=A0A2R6Y469_9BACL|nr:MAG: Zn-dependent hydrolase (beta-lactamase superfamily) [Candidatus Carbobacillus altaicus]